MVNAFTGEHAKGNQCCVLFIDDMENTAMLRQMAEDFNLPATTFLKRISEDTFQVRWFAPVGEIDLCGHGTIAATWVLNRCYGLNVPVVFQYSEGTLIGTASADGVFIEGDAIPCSESTIPDHITKGFHGLARAYFKSDGKHLVLFDTEQVIRAMKPDWTALRASNVFSYAITAQGDEVDFVSRVLLPHLPFLEDHATGSSHMVLAPFWSEKLNKSELLARQLSQRGGEMTCTFPSENRVKLLANCKIFGRGSIMPD